MTLGGAFSEENRETFLTFKYLVTFLGYET